MSDTAFTYDAYLSHSAKDKAVVRPLAERLRKDGLNVWPVPPERLGVGGFDEWAIAKSESVKGKRASELQPSAFSLQPVLRDPLNKERRFILLRLDDIGLRRRSLEVRHLRKTRFLPRSAGKTPKLGLTC